MPVTPGDRLAAACLMRNEEVGVSDAVRRLEVDQLSDQLSFSYSWQARPATRSFL